MGRFIGSLFSNDSTIGRIMTALWIMIGANLLFAITALPVVTIGPGLVSVHYVMLMRLHRDSSLSPFRTFSKGMKKNLKQGTVCWLVFLLLCSFLIVDIRFCNYQGGILIYFKYGLYAILFFIVMLMIHLIPVMAAFDDTSLHLLRNSLFFMSKNPLRAVLLAVIWLVPAALTYLDERMRPLYGFLWVTCLVGILSAVGSSLLYNDIAKYIPKTDEDEEEGIRPEGSAGHVSGKKSDRQIRKEMKDL